MASRRIPSPTKLGNDKTNFSRLRLSLISLDVLAAAALVATVIVVPPSELSRGFSVIIIASGVIPGLMLTGAVKMLNTGFAESPSDLRLKVTISALTNLIIGGASAWIAFSNTSLMLMATFTLIAALGSTAQSFSSVWYYVQRDKVKLFVSKVVSVGVKVAFAGSALASSEVTFALVGILLATLVDFGFNCRSLYWRPAALPALRSGLISPLGVAYGITRLASAVVRLGLVQLFGLLIASFLIIEQLMGGLNSIFEKYFLNSRNLRRPAKIFKVIYLLVMVATIPWLLIHPMQFESDASLAWLALTACAGLLPMAEMYAALRQRGENFVAIGSASLSVLCITGLGLAAWQGELARAALVAYVALPSFTFLFYWVSSIYVSNNSQL
jgi:hypothetical protein